MSGTGGPPVSVDSTTTPTPTSSSSDPAKTSRAPQSSGGGSGGNSFYNNTQLFYILIAVLGAFALVSSINLWRTRRRRRQVLQEAERLGLMVPGMDGYVPMRERPSLIKADGWRLPDWWEVSAKDDIAPASNATPSLVSSEQTADPLAATAEAPAPSAGPSSSRRDSEDYGGRGALEVPPLDQLIPLAVVPVPEVVDEPPKPWSPLPFFPNYVSYLKSAHDPKPQRFPDGDPHAFDKLEGEPVDVVVAVRMPSRPFPAPDPNALDDDDEVMREWAGLELGVAQFTVALGPNHEPVESQDGDLGVPLAPSGVQTPTALN